MGLLERVQKKAGGEERPIPRIDAPPAATEVITATPLAPAAPAAPLSPAVPPPPVDDRPPLAPQRATTPTAVQRNAPSKTTPQQAQFTKLKSRVHARLVEEMQDEEGAQREDIVNKINELATQVLAESGTALPRHEKLRLVESLINDVLGLGPLEALLNDPEISEIMINGPRQIYVEQRGKITVSPVVFESNSQLMQVIDRVVSSIGRRVDESSPMVDARLKDGSRVNVIIPPLALNGPTMTIRKFAAERYNIDDLIRFRSITREMAEFLRACVRSRLNTLVSGGTGSGKTTTLNIISSFIQDDERIITIEDAAELQLHQEHVVTLESRPANVEGRGRISIRDLVINSLRMRPDRIVVGECRGGEALDMLQAMNTGHDGSLTTIHANSPQDTMNRLETLVLMAGAELPSRAIREQIASAIDIVVQQSRMRDGTRKIVNISEVVGIDETGTIRLQDIFVFKQQGIEEDGSVRGYFTATGVVPQCMEHLLESGEELPVSMFQPSSPS